ncbi:MAG TPA: DUF488 domain-containing protein [Candidatus Acidoferrales bacterium]|nr:DUF488 domain-containing protein [Candidatus Acidoferrales bacterium]
MSDCVFTIGHSTHEIERFLELLRAHGITAVGDVRSNPYSRMNPQYNREPLKAVLTAAGIAYVFLGRELGARSDDPSCYQAGKVQYDRLARTPLFLEGLERVREGMARYRLALMCAEKEPLECHRGILVSRHLDAAGIGVQHILADGSLESHTAAIERLRDQLNLPESDLFRTPQEVLEDAYRLQGERIAYETA